MAACDLHDKACVHLDADELQLARAIQLSIDMIKCDSFIGLHYVMLHQRTSY